MSENQVAANEEVVVAEKEETIDKEAIIAASDFNVPFVIKRNGVHITAEVFVGAARARSKWTGIPWVAPQISTTEATPDDKGYQHDSVFHQGIAFVGRSNVVNALNIILRRYGQDFLEDSNDPLTGKFSLELYHKTWEDLATSALAKAELEELLDGEQKKQEKAIAEATPFFEKMGAGEVLSHEEQTKFGPIAAGIRERTTKISSLRQQLANRSKKKSKEAAASTVAPV